jgi:hypothetical protein
MKQKSCIIAMSFVATYEELCLLLYLSVCAEIQLDLHEYRILLESRLRIMSITILVDIGTC